MLWCVAMTCPCPVYIYLMHSILHVMGYPAPSNTENVQDMMPQNTTSSFAQPLAQFVVINRDDFLTNTPQNYEP